MYLRVVGMNGPYPSANGAGSGYFVSCGNTKLMLDFGPGVFARLSAFCDPLSLDALLLSHTHWDHVSDMGVLSYCALSRGRTAEHAQGRLRVYAPEAFMAYDERLFDLSHDGSFLLGDVAIDAIPVRHPVKAWAYRIRQNGKTLVYTGDTNTVEGLEAFCGNADLLVCDACLSSDEWREDSAHLSAEHAARLAAGAHVKKLLLTHQNPACIPKQLLDEAMAVFKNTAWAESGSVYEI